MQSQIRHLRHSRRRHEVDDHPDELTILTNFRDPSSRSIRSTDERSDFLSDTRLSSLTDVYSKGSVSEVRSGHDDGLKSREGVELKRAGIIRVSSRWVVQRCKRADGCDRSRTFAVGATPSATRHREPTSVSQSPSRFMPPEREVPRTHRRPRHHYQLGRPDRCRRRSSGPQVSR